MDKSHGLLTRRSANSATRSQQVPDMKPEPYHGSVSHAANYRGAASSVSGYPAPSSAGLGVMGPSGSNSYEMMTPSSMFGGGYSMAAMPPGGMPPGSPFMSRYGAGLGSLRQPTATASSAYLPVGPLAPRGLVGAPSNPSDRGYSSLPYALVPAPSMFPFGRNKYKMALMPLFK